MTLAVAVQAENVRAPLGRQRAGEIARTVLRAERIREAMLSITFLSDAAIARLNGRHLGHRRPTDVLAFGFDRPSTRAPVIGDIYIAPGVARDNARRHGVGVREEVARLVVHGTLHVLGYDHPPGTERTASPMWRKQERLLARALVGGSEASR